MYYILRIYSDVITYNYNKYMHENVQVVNKLIYTLLKN